MKKQYFYFYWSNILLYVSVLLLKYLICVLCPPLDSDQAGLTVPASGQDLASSTRALEVVGMAHTGPRAVIDGLPAEVQETIASASCTLPSGSSLNPGV